VEFAFSHNEIVRSRICPTAPRSVGSTIPLHFVAAAFDTNAGPANSSHGRHCSPPRMRHLWVVHEKVVAFIGVVAAQREDKHFVADAQTVDNEL